MLEATATGLRDEYPVVRIVRAGDNHTRVQLSVDGPKGVGEEQAKACRRCCQNYGAAVSGLPDSIGKVYRGQCFDTVCNMKKVAAQLQAVKAATRPKPEAAKAGAKASPAAAKGAAAPSTTSNPPATVVAESDKIKQYRVALWRKALRLRWVRILRLPSDTSLRSRCPTNMRCVDQKTLSGIWEKLTEEQVGSGDVSKAAASTAAADDTKLAHAVTGVTVAAEGGPDRRSGDDGHSINGKCHASFRGRKGVRENGLFAGLQAPAASALQDAADDERREVGSESAQK